MERAKLQSLDMQQNNLILMGHHVEDAIEALKEGKNQSVMDALKDMKLILDKMGKALPKPMKRNLQKSLIK